MTDVSLAMQGAIVARLKASTPVQNLIGVRVYDRVPQRPVPPYLSIGPSQVTSEDADCIDGFEVFLQLDVWSIEPGYDECKAICDVLRRELHRAELNHDGLAFQVEHQFTNYLRDSDGLTSHGVLSFKALFDTEAE